MKKLALLLVVVTCVSVFYAKTVSQEEAYSVSMNWINHHTSETVQIMGHENIIDENGNIALYLVFFDPSGFVLLSADTRSYPILGYSVDSEVISPIPSAMTAMMKRNAEVISSIVREDIANLTNETLWSQLLNNQIPSLSRNQMQISGFDGSWNQTSPFWNNCPQAPSSQRAYVGCIPISLVQVMNYHRWVHHEFDDSDDYTFLCDTYDWGANSIHIDDDSDTFDFPNFTEINTLMGDVYSRYQGIQNLNNVEKATLCFATGVLCQVTYGLDHTSGSTYNSMIAYEKFGYLCDRTNNYSSINDDMKSYIVNEEVAPVVWTEIRHV